MAEAEQTKVCPLCAETIKAAAKVCPHCRTRQSRFVILGSELVGIVSVLIVVTAYIAIPLYFDRMFPDLSDGTSSFAFVIHRNDLSVERPVWEADQRGNDYYWLTGLVTNKGTYPWRIHGFEIRFMDDQKMTDARQVDLKKAEVFVVQPGQEHAFKIQFYSPMLTKSSKLVVRVEKATDGRERYEPSE